MEEQRTGLTTEAARPLQMRDESTVQQLRSRDELDGPSAKTSVETEKANALVWSPISLAGIWTTHRDCMLVMKYQFRF